MKSKQPKSELRITVPGPEVQTPSLHDWQSRSLIFGGVSAYFIGGSYFTWLFLLNRSNTLLIPALVCGLALTLIACRIAAFLICRHAWNVAARPLYEAEVRRIYHGLRVVGAAESNVLNEHTWTVRAVFNSYMLLGFTASGDDVRHDTGGDNMIYFGSCTYSLRRRLAGRGTLLLSGPVLLLHRADGPPPLRDSYFYNT